VDLECHNLLPSPGNHDPVAVEVDEFRLSRLLEFIVRRYRCRVTRLSFKGIDFEPLGSARAAVIEPDLVPEH